MPTINVRYATNIEQLRTNLKEGVNQIEASTQAVARLVAALRGDNLVMAAHKWTAAISEMGGVSKIAAADAVRAFGTITKAIETLERQGKEVPAAMRDLAKELGVVKAAADNSAKAADLWSGALKTATGVLGAFGVSLSVGALVNFGKSLLSTASQLTDLKAATGVSMQDLQRLGFIGVTVGVNMDELGRAVGTLSERLASGDKSAVEAVSKLGLNLDRLLAAGPKEAFVQLGDAVGRIQDPMEKNAIAADLFGAKLSKNLIPLLGNLREEMEKVPKESLISDAQLEAADKMGDAWDRLIIKAKAYAFAVLGTMGLGHEAPKGDFEATIKMLEAAGVHSGKIFDDWAAHLAKEAAETAQQIAAVERAAMLGPGFVEGLRYGSDAIDKIHEAMRGAADDAAKKLTIAAKELAAAIREVEHPTRDVIFQMQDLMKIGVAEKVDDWSDSFENLLDKLAKIQQEGIPVIFTQTGLHQVGGRIEEVGKQVDGLPPKIQKATDTLGDLARAFATLQQASGGSLGATGDELGKAIGLAGLFETALTGIGTTAGASLGKTLSAFLAITAALVAAGPVIKSYTEDVNRALGLSNLGLDIGNRAHDVHAWIDSVGGLQVILDKTGLSAERINQAIFEALNAKTPAEFAAALAIVNDRLAAAGQLVTDLAAGGFLSHDELIAKAEQAYAVYKKIADGVKTGQYTAEQATRAELLYQQALAAAGNEAAKAWLKIHDAANAAATDAEKATSAQQKALDALKSKRDSLVEALSHEAPEERKGWTELGMEADLANTNVQIAAHEAQIKASAEESASVINDVIGGAAEDAHIDLQTGIEEGLSGAGVAAEGARGEIASVFSAFKIAIPFYFYQEGPGPDGGGERREEGFAAEGGIVGPMGIQPWSMGESLIGPRGSDRHLTWLAEGETVRTPKQEAALGGGGDTGGGGESSPIDVHAHLYLDSIPVGEQVIRNVAYGKRGQDKKLKKALGLK